MDQNAANVKHCEALPLPVLAPPWRLTRELSPLETEIEVQYRYGEVERHWTSLFEDGVLEESLEPFL